IRTHDGRALWLGHRWRKMNFVAPHSWCLLFPRAFFGSGRHQACRVGCSPILNARGVSTMATINDVWTAYEEARAGWSGCNWPTHYGSLGLDLKDLTSADAHRAAGVWRAIAANAEAGDEFTGTEEAALVDMALHLRLRRAVVSFDGLLRVCK